MKYTIYELPKGVFLTGNWANTIKGDKLEYFIKGVGRKKIAISKVKTTEIEGLTKDWTYSRGAEIYNKYGYYVLVDLLSEFMCGISAEMKASECGLGEDIAKLFDEMDSNFGFVCVSHVFPGMIFGIDMVQSDRQIDRLYKEKFGELPAENMSMKGKLIKLGLDADLFQKLIRDIHDLVFDTKGDKCIL